MGEKEQILLKYLISEFKKGVILSRVQIRNYSKSIGLNDESIVKEITEFAILKFARNIVENTNGGVSVIYPKLVEFYENQPFLSLRTSNSILLQQYSTPLPVAYLMGYYCNIDDEQKSVFEPSAGNGLLTVASGEKTSHIIVNELDELRFSNLKSQGFKKVFQQDGSQDLSNFLSNQSFDAILTNPPFGALDKYQNVSFDNFKITSLEHLMSIRALNTLKKNGKAAIIIGGHTEWDNLGRVTSGKNRIFLNYIYRNYNVEDIILLGSFFFRKMGTGFKTRLILINGKKSEPNGFSPLKNEAQSNVVDSFDELYTRIVVNESKNKNIDLELLKAKLKLELLLTNIL